MKISVCLDALYNGVPIVKSVKRVQELGFTTIEFWCWWEKDLDQLEKVLAETGIKVSTFCTKFISLVDASQHDAYIEGLVESIAVAKRFGVDRLITQVGDDTGEERSVQQSNLVAGLGKCIPYLEEAGITLMVEPLNTLVDHQGYYLYHSKEAFEIIDQVHNPQINILFDIYHQQIMEGNLINTIRENIDSIGHFHAAGNPGRHELDEGEINYTAIFEMLEDINYQGYVGLEYFPLRKPEIGLKEVLESTNYTR